MVGNGAIFDGQLNCRKDNGFADGVDETDQRSPMTGHDRNHLRITWEFITDQRQGKTITKKSFGKLNRDRKRERERERERERVQKQIIK